MIRIIRSAGSGFAGLKGGEDQGEVTALLAEFDQWLRINAAELDSWAQSIGNRLSTVGCTELLMYNETARRLYVEAVGVVNKILDAGGVGDAPPFPTFFGNKFDVVTSLVGPQIRILVACSDSRGGLLDMPAVRPGVLVQPGAPLAGRRRRRRGVAGLGIAPLAFAGYAIAGSLAALITSVAVVKVVDAFSGNERARLATVMQELRVKNNRIKVDAIQACVKGRNPTPDQYMSVWDECAKKVGLTVKDVNPDLPGGLLATAIKAALVVGGVVVAVSLFRR